MVISGDMERFVETENPRNACAAAVLLERCSEEPSSLGIIMFCIEVTPDSEQIYYRTENACKDADLWEIEGGWEYVDSEGGA